MFWKNVALMTGFCRSAHRCPSQPCQKARSGVVGVRLSVGTHRLDFCGLALLLPVLENTEVDVSPACTATAINETNVVIFPNNYRFHVH